MKKQTLTIVLACIVGTALNAQEAETTTQSSPSITSKKGISILPRSGDIGLGVDAVPFLEYMGNSFNNSTGNTVSNNFTRNDQTIYGKYFLSDQSAVRARIRIGYNNVTTKNLVTDDTDNTGQGTVEDKRAVSSMNIALGGGYEMRRGKGRVQGFYGGEGWIGFASGGSKFTYGNDFSSTNTDPTSTTDFDLLAVGGGNGRLTQTKNGSTISVGARGFIGAEYFFAPKMSIGAEFGWGLGFSTTGQGEATSEAWNGSDAEETTVETANGGSFILDTDNASGAIILMMYF